MIHSCISVFCMHLFISVASLLWMEANFLNQNPCRPSRPGVFQFDIFSVDLSASYVHLRAFFLRSQLCFHVVYPFGIFVMIFPFTYLAQKSSCLFRIQLLVCHRPFTPYFRIFFRCFGTSCFFMYCLVLSRYLFSLPSFAIIFCLVSSSFIFRSSCRSFLVSPECILIFYFSIFACCHRFLIFDSILSSLLSFDFLSVVFRGTPILLQTNFAPAYIESFNSEMSFFGVSVNKSFTFSVSDLTFFQTWFLREDNVIFFLDIILLMISTFVFVFRVSVCVCGFAVYGSQSWSFWFGVSGFPVFSVSVTVLGVYW